MADRPGTDPHAPQGLGDFLDPANRDTRQVHLHHRFLDRRLAATMPLDDGGFKFGAT